MKHIAGRFFFLLTLGFSLFFFGCSGNQNLISGDWEIYALESEGIMQQIALSNIHIEKQGASLLVNGNSGVNTFFGDAKISKHQIAFSDKMASTKMAGSPDAMEFEDLFLSMISGIKKYEVFQSSNQTFLKIYKSKNTSITFKKI